MSIQNLAQSYIDRGWQVIPILAGKKRAATSWQKETYTADQFHDGDNIALKCGEPSGWLVDFDLDCHEAVDAARLLLPDTGLIHGRIGKPDSHWWFRCVGQKTTTFTNIKSDASTPMLVEIRSTNGYTIIPNSVWTDDPAKGGDGHTEEVLWSFQRDPLELTLDAAYDAACNVAITSLMLRQWRALHHADVGHFVGFLLQGGVEPNRVLRICSSIEKLAPAGSTAGMMDFVRTTIGKFAAGERITGGPKLENNLGEGVAKLRGWLKLRDTDALEDFNRVHFFVRMGKDAVIGREDDPSGVVFQQTRALYTEYANRKIVIGEDKKGNPKYASLFEEWLAAPNRRSYRKVIFAPPPLPADPVDYNLWQGYAITPAAGDCRRYLDHVHDVICAGQEEHFVYLMNLLALTVQEPGTPSRVATVLRGGQGSGKGAFMQPLLEIFGRRHSIQLDKTDQVTGHFNSAISSKCLIFADEAFWAGDKREIGALKRLVTEPTLAIERKGLDVAQEDNHVHLFMATNNEWSWPAELDDRRGFLLAVSDSHKGDTTYFDRLFEEFSHGGATALMDLLLAWSIDRRLLASVPKTAERRNQQIKSLNYIETWLHECLMDGTIGVLAWPGGRWMPCADLFKIYADWLALRRGRLCSNIEFGQATLGFFSAEKSKVRKMNGAVVRCVLMRDLADARIVFDNRIGSTGDWLDADPDVNQTIF